MADYEPVILEAARDLLARLGARTSPGPDVKQLRTALGRQVERVARDLGVTEREVWQGLRRVLEERGYEFARAGEAGREALAREVGSRVEAIGDRLVRKGLVVKRERPDGRACWALNTTLPPAEALHRRASLDARERAFLEALGLLGRRRSLAG